MNILIIEDDPAQYDFIKKTLLENKEFSVNKIERIKTELEFRKKFNDLIKTKPDVIIMDVMLRWTNLGEEGEEIELPPKEIQEESYYRAGIRCIEMLKDNQETKDIPVLVYSILDKEDLEDELRKLPQTKYLFKDFEARKIVNSIKSRLS